MSLLLSRGIPRVALFLGLRRFPGTIRYREAGPTVVPTGRRRYAKTRRREGNTDQRRATEQPQGNNNNNKKNNGRQFIQQFRSQRIRGECSATGNLRDLRVLRGKNRPPGLVDGRLSGRRAFLCTTENTEVTEALGSLGSHSAALRIRFDVSFLGLRRSGFAVPPR